MQPLLIRREKEKVLSHRRKIKKIQKTKTIKVRKTQARKPLMKAKTARRHHQINEKAHYLSVCMLYVIFDLFSSKFFSLSVNFVSVNWEFFFWILYNKFYNNNALYFNLHVGG